MAPSGRPASPLGRPVGSAVLVRRSLPVATVLVPDARIHPRSRGNAPVERSRALRGTASSRNHDRRCVTGSRQIRRRPAVTPASTTSLRCADWVVDLTVAELGIASASTSSSQRAGEGARATPSNRQHHSNDARSVVSQISRRRRRHPSESAPIRAADRPGPSPAARPLARSSSIVAQRILRPGAGIPSPRPAAST